MKKFHGKDGKVNMCKAIKEWLEDEREAGRTEGFTAGRLELIIQMYHDGDISIEKACMRLNLTEEEFIDAEKKHK